MRLVDLRHGARPANHLPRGDDAGAPRRGAPGGATAGARLAGLTERRQHTTPVGASCIGAPVARVAERYEIVRREVGLVVVDVMDGKSNRAGRCSAPLAGVSVSLSNRLRQGTRPSIGVTGRARSQPPVRQRLQAIRAFRGAGPALSEVSGAFARTKRKRRAANLARFWLDRLSPLPPASADGACPGTVATAVKRSGVVPSLGGYRLAAFSASLLCDRDFPDIANEGVAAGRRAKRTLQEGRWRLLVSLFQPGAASLAGLLGQNGARPSLGGSLGVPAVRIAKRPRRPRRRCFSCLPRQRFAAPPACFHSPIIAGCAL